VGNFVPTVPSLFPLTPDSRVPEREPPSKGHGQKKTSLFPLLRPYGKPQEVAISNEKNYEWTLGRIFG